MDFLYPNMPPMSLLVAVTVVIWLLVVIRVAIEIAKKGPLGVLNWGLAFALSLALLSTIVTWGVWDWAPRQVARNVSGSAGLSLIEQATGGIVELGGFNQAELLFESPNAAPSEGATTTQQPQAAVFNYTPLDNVPVVVVAQSLQLKHWDAVSWDLPSVAAESLPDQKGTVCGVWQDNAGTNWGVACPASEGKIFPLGQVDWQGAGIVLPTATSTTAAPAMSEEDKLKQIATCWLKWAESVSLRNVRESMGATILPYGTKWLLTGPGGFFDFGSWGFDEDEEWHLASPKLSIMDYVINGELARSFSGADDSGTVSYVGTGAMCTTTP